MADFRTDAASHRPRFLITNAVTLNSGDGAILRGLMRGLAEAFGADAPVQVADEAYAAAALAYPDIHFVPPLHGSTVSEPDDAGNVLRSLRRRRATLGAALIGAAPSIGRAVLPSAGRAQVDRLESVAAAIATGGTYLVEHYPLRRRLESIAVPARLGVPSYLYTQSLGPFRDRGNARRVANALRDVRHVFLRDHRSRQHLLDIGIPEDRLSVHADAAFALARPTADRPPAGDLRVAVSVRHWPHHIDRTETEGQRAYRSAIATAVRRLVEMGAEVTFVSTCQGQPSYRTDDSRYARRIIAEELHDVPRVRVDTSFHTPDALIDLLSTFDLAIATRMHFAILAMCAGTPVAPIAYEFKTAELFEGLGLGDRVVDIDAITAEALWQRVTSTLEAADETRAHVAGLLPELRRSALEPARRIREDLFGGNAA